VLLFRCQESDQLTKDETTHIMPQVTLVEEWLGVDWNDARQIWKILWINGWTSTGTMRDRSGRFCWPSSFNGGLIPKNFALWSSSIDVSGVDLSRSLPSEYLKCISIDSMKAAWPLILWYRLLCYRRVYFWHGMSWCPTTIFRQ
jgi:hypothetical protein